MKKIPPWEFAGVGFTDYEVNYCAGGSDASGGRKFVEFSGLGRFIWDSAVR